ncbi:MAG: helix-turn-helix domain-containing protein [Prolixibacteraceae bacterium]|jgi:AraC-like DNA-binding protein/quercetin dioxygenase-like cupin family protein|nr:helix-turn-helix domain-containing protein [Prolixibacteraceae bacterium]
MAQLLTNELFYPAIHESDKQWGITVSTAGFQSIEANTAYPPAGHPKTHRYHYHSGRILDEFQIVYITRGKAIFSSKSAGEQLLEEGSLFMLFPGEWHTYRPHEDTGWEAYWVGFRGDYASQLVVNRFFSPGKPFFRIGYNEEIIRLFQQITGHIKREEPGSQQLLGGIVFYMLGYLYHFQKNALFANKSIISKIDKARALMREHVNTNISTEEIAGMLHISYSWFRRSFRQYTGFSPAQYMIRLKVQRAKELLAQTNDSVKEIAGSLHFEPVDYFSVFFKRATGISPLAYRALCREK